VQKEDEETHNNEDYKSLYTENTKYKTKHTRTSLRSRPDEDLNEKIVTGGEVIFPLPTARTASLLWQSLSQLSVLYVVRRDAQG